MGIETRLVTLRGSLREHIIFKAQYRKCWLWWDIVINPNASGSSRYVTSSRMIAELTLKVFIKKHQKHKKAFEYYPARKRQPQTIEEEIYE